MHNSINLFFLTVIVLLLTGCDYFSGISRWVGESENDTVEKAQLSFAVAPRTSWMPWYLANDENLFTRHGNPHNIEVSFEGASYLDTIDQFINREVQAIVVSNIDAIAQFIQRSIEADVILITDYSYGNEALLLKPTSLNASIENQQIALREYSAQHYLLDRFLVKNIVEFDRIEVVPTLESEIVEAFDVASIYGVATSNPNIYQLVNQNDATALFDSRETPKEIMSLVIINRDTLIDHPTYPQVLLTTWFSIMERMQGGRRGPALDAMARLANVSREEYEAQIESVVLNDTPNRALSAIRDRSMRKTMRHIRYFMERHELTGEEEFTEWVSYPGRDKKLLHYNAAPLQTFIIPPKTDDT